MQVAVAKRALHGDPHCGDECAAWEHGKRVTLCVADGLGHGRWAEEASHAAVDYVRRHLPEPLEKVFSGCDLAIRHTRGVAMGIAVIDTEARTLTCGGVNNIRMMVAGQEITRLNCNDGIVGGGFRTLRPETVPLASGDLVIIYTDGLSEFARLPDCGTLPSMDLQQLAELLLDDWNRGVDDAGVLIYRYEG